MNLLLIQRSTRLISTFAITSKVVVLGKTKILRHTFAFFVVISDILWINVVNSTSSSFDTAEHMDIEKMKCVSSTKERRSMALQRYTLCDYPISVDSTKKNSPLCTCTKDVVNVLY